MKKLTKIFSLLFALTLSCSTVLTACAPDSSNSSSSSGNKPSTPQGGYTDGTHGGSETETDGYVLKDGKTDYKIVIPKKFQQMEELAANELQAIFYEATKVRLPIVTDDTVTTSDKVFSLGRTSLFAATNITVDKTELREDGFKLVTVDDDIYMCGGEDTGTLYATYEYLYRALNFEQFYADCYTLDTNVTDLKLSNYDIAERPDIGYRASSYGYLDNDTTVRNRMRVSGTKFAYFTAVGGQPCHNSFNWLPLEKYYNEHPDWYSPDKTQLCYTARGNQESLNAMLDAAMETFKGIYSAVPDMRAISLSMQDFQTWCGCSTCLAETAKYGTDSAVVVKFCNQLSRRMETYVTELNKNDPNFVYDIQLNFFAYFSTVAAPAKYDKDTDTYSPIDDTVKCDPNVVPWYAPIFLDYTQSIYADVNTTYLHNIRAWDAISETMHLWTYETCFKAYMAPYDSFNGMQELFQVLAATNADFLFNQSQWNHAKAGTAWHALKSYLTAKLSWDSTQDINELIDRYFAAMYGPATNTMREWFNSTRAYCAYLHSIGLYKGAFSVYYEADVSDCFSYSILRTWMNYANKALSEIEKYKTADPELYARYYGHIITERISPDYLILLLYESRLNKNEAREILERLKVDSLLAGVTAPGEGGSFQTILNNWILQD